MKELVRLFAKDLQIEEDLSLLSVLYPHLVVISLIQSQLLPLISYRSFGDWIKNLPKESISHL